MKKTIPIILCLLLVLLMVGCAKEDNNAVKKVTINKNGIRFDVDTKNHSVTRFCLWNKINTSKCDENRQITYKVI